MYLTESKTVLCSAFSAVSYLTSRLSTILIWSISWIHVGLLMPRLHSIQSNGGQFSSRIGSCSRQQGDFLAKRFSKKNIYTSMDFRRDRKCTLKFREMLETPKYAQGRDAEERRQIEAQKSKRRYTLGCVLLRCTITSLASNMYRTLLVTTSLSKLYRKRQSETTGDTETRRKREAKTQADKHQAESTQEAEARRKGAAKVQAAKCKAESTQAAEAKTQATKRRSETPQGAEKRRQQHTQAKKRYIAYLCFYMTPPLSKQET